MDEVIAMPFGDCRLGFAKGYHSTKGIPTELRETKGKRFYAPRRSGVWSYAPTLLPTARSKWDGYWFTKESRVRLDREEQDLRVTLALVLILNPDHVVLQGLDEETAQQLASLGYHVGLEREQGAVEWLNDPASETEQDDEEEFLDLYGLQGVPEPTDD